MTTTYVEPFCGSAGVMVNRIPSRREIANDLDGDVINFFRVLREREAELLEKLSLTPYHPGELAACREALESGTTDSLERARAFYVRQQQTLVGRKEAIWKFGYAGPPVRPGGRTWNNRLEKLHAVAKRLHGVEWYCGDGVKLIESFDDEDVLIYCDPPYDRKVRKSGLKAYSRDTTDELQERFLAAVSKVSSKVAVSHYPCEMYDTALAGWTRHDMPTVIFSRNSKDQPPDRGVEALYCNYAMPEQATLPSWA